jgi:hypothetical protein
MLDANFPVVQFWINKDGKPTQLETFSHLFTKEIQLFNPCLRVTPIETRRMVITAAFEQFKEEELIGENIEKRITQFEKYLNVHRKIMERNYDKSEISIVYSEAQRFSFFLLSLFFVKFYFKIEFFQ